MYANMAAENNGGGQIAKIRHNILVKWALEPPTFQMLRPIDVLISTIQTVLPPAFGVANHNYFSTWVAVNRENLMGEDVEAKLVKALRVVRFFLHPDKLPRNFNNEQRFVCKLLWDITSDAMDDYNQHKENHLGRGN